MKNRTAALIFALILIPGAVLAQTPVGTEFQINTYTTNLQGGPSMAVAENGDFVVAWDSAYQDGTVIGIFAQRYSSDGLALGGEFQVNSYTTGNQQYPSVTQVPSGFVVAWFDGGQNSILTQRFSSNGSTLGSEITVNTNSDLNSPRPRLASDLTGRFLVVWRSTNGRTVFSRLFGSSGTPVNPTQQTVNSFTTNLNMDAQPLALSNGEFRVIWWTKELSGGRFGPFEASNILGRKLNASGGATGAEFLVNTYTTGTHDQPSVTATDTGFTVVWTEDNTGYVNGQIWGQRLQSNGAKIGSEFQVNGQTTGYQRNPEITSDTQGGFVVVWNDLGQYPTPATIEGRHFNSSATPTGSFQVNSATFSTLHPSVDNAADGDFVVAWTSIDQDDGYGGGVFGQRFASNQIFSDGFESGDLTEWSSTEPPTTVPGDDCTVPLVLPPGIPVLGQLSNNTASGAADTCGTNNTIDEWFTINATCTGTLTVTTCRPGTDVDTILSAWSGCDGGELACNDDDPVGNLPECEIGGFNRKSTISFSVTTGQFYDIRVSAFGDDFSNGSSYDMIATCQ